MTHVINSRSPGGDPVLKVDRLTHLKFYIFPISGKGPCSEGEQVDPCYWDPEEGQVDPCFIFPFAGKGPVLKVYRLIRIKWNPVLQVDPY